MTTMQYADDSREHAPAAWRRPGVVFVMYAYRLVVALLVALPISVLFGAAINGQPRRDAVLFDDGAMFFVEVIRRSSSAIGPIGISALVLLAVASFASILPLAAVIGALATKGRVTARDVGAFALRPVGPFALLFGVFAGVQVVVLAIVSAVGGAISRRPMFDAPGSDRVKIVALLVALLLVLIVGVFHDLARVAVVRDELGFRASLSRALATFKKSHVLVLAAWATRAGLGAIAIFAALSFVSRLGVESMVKVVAGSLVYQASILVALFLRASWLASAIRHVDAARPISVPSEPEPVTTAAEQAAPVESNLPEVVAPTAAEEHEPAQENVSPLPAVPPAENPETADNVDARA